MKTVEKALIIILVFMMLSVMSLVMFFAVSPDYGPPGTREGRSISIIIEDTMDAADIESLIQDAIDNASPGDTITIIGDKTSEDAVIRLDIPASITVVWKALSKDLSFDIGGGGTFEVASGGKIEVAGKNAISVYIGNVIVSGGEVSVLRSDDTDLDERRAISVNYGNVTVTDGKVSTSRNSAAIYIYQGNVTVSGGVVSATGETVNGVDTDYCYGIQLGYDGAVSVMGGIVSATGAAENNAINIYLGLAAYYKGTCVGDLRIGYNSNYGIIVEVDSLDIPIEYHKTSNGLTTVKGGSNADAHWDTFGAVPTINYESVNAYASYSARWGGVVSSPPPVPVASPVRLSGTGDVFETLSEAIATAKSRGLSTYTLEVIGDVTETNDIVISSENITIIGAGGKHTVTMPSGRVEVDGGGSLTLGSGTTENDLTILHSIRVSNGTIHVKDGIILKSVIPLNLTGPDVGGIISGGRVEGSRIALSINNGAQLQEISGGTFIGIEDAVHVSGVNTKVGEISGGSFYQIDPDMDSHGHAFFVQNYAQIGEISGGYFHALRNSSLVVIRGAWVEEISGGTFVANRYGVLSSVPGEDTRNAAIWIESEQDVTTGIGTISGGEINGTNFGVLLIQWYNSNTGARINKITGGTFMGTVALQNDVGSDIDEIVGGTFIGSQGIFNVGRIKFIGGDVDINCTTYGIFNYRTLVKGQIDEIGGGKISGGEYGIANWGTVTLISDGTIIGGRSAINNNGLNPGLVETITGGVFGGKTGPTINLAPGYPLTLEPDLTGSNAVKGVGRYQGNGGVIFNNESLVNYPGTAPDIYFMSTNTESVSGITDTKFKYLTLSSLPIVEVTFDSNGGNFADGSTTDTRILGVGDSLGTDMPDAPKQTGFAFLGWNTQSDGAGSEFTGSTVVTDNITVYAKWGVPLNDYEVFVNGSHAPVTGSGTYKEGTTVTIHAGSQSGHTFTGWTVNAGAAVLADESAATTTFTMPSEDVTVTANWRSNESGGGGGGGTGGGTIIDGGGNETKPPEETRPEPPGPIIIVLLYAFAVAAFAYNTNREYNIKKMAEQKEKENMKQQ